MNDNGLGPKTNITLNISGSCTIPLHLKALESLEDQMLQDEIMREAARLALAEKFSGFDKITIHTNHNNNKYGNNNICEAKVDFTELCCAIANVQHAYEFAMQHMLELKELIETNSVNNNNNNNNNTDNNNNNNNNSQNVVFTEIGNILQRALEGPGESPLAVSIRAEAIAKEKKKKLHFSSSSTDNNDNDNDNDIMIHSNSDNDSSDTISSDSICNPQAMGYAPLLDENNEESEEEDGEAAPLN